MIGKNVISEQAPSNFTEELGQKQSKGDLQYMCMCVYIYIYIYIYICLYTYIYTSLSLSLSIYIYIYTYAFVVKPEGARMPRAPS